MGFWDKDIPQQKVVFVPQPLKMSGLNKRNRKYMKGLSHIGPYWLDK